MRETHTLSRHSGVRSDVGLLQHFFEIHTYQSHQLQFRLALICLCSSSSCLPTCCPHLKASKCYELEFPEISLDLGLLPMLKKNTHKRGMSLVCPIPVGGVAAGQVLAFKYPLSLYVPQTGSHLKGSSLVIIPEGVSCPFRLTAPLRLPGSYRILKATMPLHRAYWPLVSLWRGIGEGQDEVSVVGIVCPSSPFPAPPPPPLTWGGS